MKRSLLFVLFFFVICGLFVAVFYPVLAFGYGDNSWHTKASMSQARSGLGVAVVDGKIYAIGGYIAYKDVVGYCVGTNERYDPKTDIWCTLKCMPTPRMSFATAVYEDKIYCIGGNNVNADNTYVSFKVIEIYDTVLDSWSVKSDAPFFGNAQAHVVDGKIFVTHGRDLFLYDPVADSWTNKTSIPTSWGHGYVSAVADDKIIFSYNYYPNGSPSEQPIEIVMIYDTKTDTYSEGSTPPKAYSSYAATAMATSGVYAPQRIYILGMKYEILNSNTVYDPINDVWLTAKALHAHRCGFGVAVVDDVIYVIGGERRGLGILDVIIPYKVFSTNQQYIPVGYSGSVDTSESLLNNRAVTTLILTAGIATCILIFYFKKKKRKKRLRQT